MGIPVLIDTATLSNATHAEFDSSDLTSTYKQYMFIFTDINPATDSQTLQFNVSKDNGDAYNEIQKTTTFFRSQVKQDGSGSGIAIQSALDLQSDTGYQAISSDLGNGSDESTSGVLYLFNPADTTFVKNFYSRFSCYHSGDYANDMYAAGYMGQNDASALNAIRFQMASGNLDGVIQMYGIK